MQIKFRVEGQLPPKKDGASTMWKKDTEVPRLLALRRSARIALAGQGPLEREIWLTLRVYVGTKNDRGTGDLDNFVTGVCDGLMAAAVGIPWQDHPAWQEDENALVRPDRCVAILDDSQVVQVHAYKIVGRHPSQWYEVELTEGAAAE